MAFSTLSKRSLLWVLTFLAVLGFVALLFSTAGPFRSVFGNGVSAQQANKKLWNCLVPEDATDVWFTSGYRATRVECKLTRQSFVKWCKREGWDPLPLASDTYSYSSRLDGTVRIRNGLRFSDYYEDAGFGGVYDEEEGRCYVSYCGG